MNKTPLFPPNYLHLDAQPDGVTGYLQMRWVLPVAVANKILQLIYGSPAAKEAEKACLSEEPADEK